MNHSFNIDLAKKFGVDGAIILENLYFWIQKNKANKKHFYDGEYWTYNSVSAFSELFPYWSSRQIERILKNLEKNGAIKIWNYNKLAYDRTKWYAITQTVKSIYANGEMDLHEKLNGNTQTVEPIPDINTDIKSNIKAFNNSMSSNSTTHLQKEIIDYLNLKTNSNYKYTTKKTQTLINTRLKESFTLSDFKKVIDKKVSDWAEDKKMNKFLRPETLFGTKFESYLNEKNSYSAPQKEKFESTAAKLLREMEEKEDFSILNAEIINDDEEFNF